MYLIEIRFEIISDYAQEKQEDLIEYLYADWSSNGQILSDSYQYAKTTTGYKMYQTIPEKNSLSNQYNNKYAKEHIANLKNVGLGIPTITIVDDTNQDEDLCNCKQKSDYILYATYASFSPSLRCKKCFKTIPLYKIPKLDKEDDNYHLLTSWESDYKDCDSLQMNCSIGEKFGLRQMSSIDSQLTKDGLEVCAAIEEATGIKTYYYLYKYTARSRKQELLRKCPKCQDEWLLDTPLHKQFDFECKKCGLLSNIGWDKR